MDTGFTTPILIIAWRRPKHIQNLINELRKIKPINIFVAVDGPRIGEEFKEERNLIEQTKQIINTEINWNCNVLKTYQNANLGCKNAVEHALKWFFSNVEEGIILEDDIIPDTYFFTYCKVNLAHFRNNPKIFSINGCNFGFNSNYTKLQYTKYFNMWGWATWRRSFTDVQEEWKSFESVNCFNPLLVNSLRNPFIFNKSRWLRDWLDIFQRTKLGQIDTWDYQWIYTCLVQNKLCLIPPRNLIINLGFDGSGTHTFGNNPLGKLTFSNLNNEFKSNPKLRTNLFFDFKYVAIRWAAYHTIWRKMQLKIIHVLAKYSQ